jgi:hypothetical protein
MYANEVLSEVEEGAFQIIIELLGGVKYVPVFVSYSIFIGGDNEENEGRVSKAWKLNFFQPPELSLRIGGVVG